MPSNKQCEIMHCNVIIFLPCVPFFKVLYVAETQMAVFFLKPYSYRFEVGARWFLKCWGVGGMKRLWLQAWQNQKLLDALFFETAQVKVRAWFWIKF